MYLIKACCTPCTSCTCCEEKRIHIRMAGLCDAGKSCFVKWVKHRQFIKTAPTTVLEVDEAAYGGLSLVFWDSRNYSDEAKTALIRSPHLNHASIYAMRSDMVVSAMVFCVDSSDAGRFKLAGRHLVEALSMFPKVVTLLVLCMKSDLPTAVGAEELQRILHLRRHAADRVCRMFSVSALTGDGMEEAIDWLLQRLRENLSICEQLQLLPECCICPFY
eukprot:Lankesteria_metandrocarpae@DN7310_c0_g1_i1.p1